MREYNRSLIENLIRHETANKSTGKSEVVYCRCALDQRIYFCVRVLCHFKSNQRNDDDGNDDDDDDKNAPTKLYG